MKILTHRTNEEQPWEKKTTMNNVTSQLPKVALRNHRRKKAETHTCLMSSYSYLSPP